MLDLNANILIFTISLILGYFSRWKQYLNFFDPLQLLSINEAIWGTTIFQLYKQDIIPQYDFVFLISILLLWLLSNFILSLRYGDYYKKIVIELMHRVDTKQQQNRLITITYFIVAIIFSFAIIFLDQTGDNRLYFYKKFRILQGVVTILFPLVCYVLYSIKKYRWLSLAILLYLIQGGKSGLISLFFPLSLLIVTKKIRINAKLFAKIFIASGLVLFILIPVLFKIPKSELTDLLTNRILMDGDAYIYNYVLDATDGVKIGNILTYIFGPFFKLFYFIDVDKSLGAQMASSYLGEDVATGPNGHWDLVLIHSSLHNHLFIAGILSLIFFSCFVLLKLRGLGYIVNTLLHKTYSFFIPLIFCILSYSLTFYQDPPFFTNFFIQSIFVGIILFLINHIAHARNQNKSNNSSSKRQ